MQIQKIGKIAAVNCCKQITRQLRRNKFERDNLHLTLLTELASETNVLRPYFTAGGYFELNNTTIIKLFNMITTYVILIIQFNTVPK